MSIHANITIDPLRRGGKPCVRGLRISVGDVLEWLSQGRNVQDVLDDYPELVRSDILDCLAYAAARESHEVRLVATAA